jgi:tetratricopeptide (TPR) repeat protein
LLALIGAGLALGAVGAWGEYQFRLARAELQHHHYDKAQEHITACLRVQPRSALAHLLAARIDRRQGHFTRALEHLNEAQHLMGVADAIDLERLMVKAEAEDVNPLETYAIKYLKEHAAGDSKDLDPLRNHPDGVAILEALVRGYLKQYRYPEAWGCIQTWIRWQPDDTEALYCRAWEAMQLQRLDQTETDCRRILEIEPDNFHGRSLLAECLSVQHRASEAAEHFTFLRQYGFFPTDMALGLARCQRELGHTEEAIQILEEILAREPKNAEALRQRGNIALDGGDPLAAERWLSTALEQNPYDPSAIYSYEQALERCGKTTEAREQLAKLGLLRKDMQRAEEITTNLLGRDPDNADLHCEVGAIFLRNGQENTGLESLYRALALNPNHVGAHRALMEYYDRIGRPEDARPHREFLRQRQQPAAGTPADASTPSSLSAGP